MLLFLSTNFIKLHFESLWMYYEKKVNKQFSYIFYPIIGDWNAGFIQHSTDKVLNKVIQNLYYKIYKKNVLEVNGWTI